MATAVIGLSYRERWNSAGGRANADRANEHLRSEVTMAANGFTDSQRDHAGMGDHLARPRLPSISNFLQSTGQLEIGNRPRYDDAVTPNTAFANGLPPARPISSPSSNHNPWSPQDDLRQKSQIDQRPSFHTRSNSEAHFNGPEARQHPNLVHPPMLLADMRGPPPLPMAPSAHDPEGPNARTTGKRLVGEEVVVGKGLCYVYDDGTVCQKIINGDTVNPKWGTTKAGKPRKRLGQACNTCREKKIKCDPSFPKCTQCQKFNRECRFDPATRSNPKSPKMRATAISPADSHILDEALHDRSRSTAPPEGSLHSDTGMQSTPRQTCSEDERSSDNMELARPRTNDASTPSKRARPVDSHIEKASGPNKRSNDDSHLSSNLPPRQPYSLTTDPFSVDKTTTRACLDIFFGHSRALKHSMIPREPFLSWLERDDRKSLDSILVIYTMLAWACALENNADRVKLGIIFDEIVLEGMSRPVEAFSLQQIQARAIFTMHSFQLGNFERAWLLCGTAIRTASAMRLYTEDGIDAQCRNIPAPYHLDPARLAESMRRTFWCLFQLDRIGVSCLGWSSPLDKSEVCLRIPCSDVAFASGHIPRCEVYDGVDGLLTTPGDKAMIGQATLVRRVQMFSLCGDVYHLAFRSRLQTLVNQSQRMVSRRRELERSLSSWNHQYTRDLKNNQSSMPSAGSADVSEVGGLHILYHNACMTLHRHIHHLQLTQSEVAEHLKAAYFHACRTLEIAQQLVSHGNKDIYDYHIAADDPTTGYAILNAIDIITAAGVLSDMLEDQSRLMALILPGIELIDRLGSRWASAKIQQEAVTERLGALLRAAKGGVAGGKVAFFITDPMAASYGRENDVVYGTDRLRYLKVLGLGSGVMHEADLLPVYIRQEYRP